MLSALLFSNTAVYADTVSEGEPSQEEVVIETGNTSNLSSTTSSNSSNNLNDTVSGTDITEDSNSNTTTENNIESERTVSLDLSNDSTETLDMTAMLSESKVNEPKQEKTEEEKKKEEEEKKKKEEERRAHAWDCFMGNHTWEKQDELHTFTWRDGVHYHEDVYKCKYCSEVKYDNRQQCTFEGDFEYDSSFSNERINGKYCHIESRVCSVCKEQKETRYVECKSNTVEYNACDDGTHHFVSGACDVCGNDFKNIEACSFTEVINGNENHKKCPDCGNVEDKRSTKPENIKVEVSSKDAGNKYTVKNKDGKEVEVTAFDEKIKLTITAEIESLDDKKCDDVKNSLSATIKGTQGKKEDNIVLTPVSLDGKTAKFEWESEDSYEKIYSLDGVRIVNGQDDDKYSNTYEFHYQLRNVKDDCAVISFNSEVNGGNGWKLDDNHTWYSKKVNDDKDLTVKCYVNAVSEIKSDKVSIDEIDDANAVKDSISKDSIKVTSNPHYTINWWFFIPYVDIDYYENIIEFTVPADVDGVHKYKVNYGVLKAYHDGIVTTFIDNTAPTYSDAEYKSEAKRLNGKFYNKDVVVSVNANDAHLDSCKSVITVSNESNKGFVSYSNDCQTGKLEVTATQEGVHTVTGKIYDLAGNCTEIKNQKEFIIDTTAPKFETPVYTSEAKKLNGKFFNKDVEVSVKVSDLYLSQESFIEVSGKKETLAKDKDTIKLNVTAEGEYSLIGKIYDLAGNCTEIKDQDEFIIDKTAPTLKITFDNHMSKNQKYYKADRTATFVFEDKYIDENEAKMSKVKVNAQEGKVSDVKEMSGSNGKYTGSILFAADGIYSIGDLSFQDKAGNDVVVTSDSDKDYNAEFVIDKTAPTLKVTFNNHDFKHDKYYKADRTATFVFEDRNIDSQEATMAKVKLNEKEGKATVHEMSGSNGKYTGSIVFDKDGIYSIGEISFEDKAGNMFVFGEGHEKEYASEFVIDKTVPVAKIEFDNNSSLNGNYFKAARKAEITITEKNFTAEQVTYERINSDLSVLPALQSYSKKDLKNITHVDFDKDGRYGFTIVCEDLAGNISEKVSSDEFYIDMTLPEIEISGVEDMSANNGKVAPVVVSKDANLTDACTEISLVGSNNGKVTPSITKTNGAETFTYSFADMAHEKENDDLYTLSVKLTDLAGNTVEKSVKYSLNRFGSIFVLSDATKAMVDGYYVTKPQDVVITEINVDSLTKKEVSVAFDGNVKELREGASFTTNDKTNSNGWHSISYNVGKSNFNKDGIYSVAVFSEDRATNKQSNQAKDAEIEFLLDKTAPSVIVSGLEDGGIYEEESHDFSVNAADTIGVTSMKVYLNDEKLASFTADELNENGGTAVLTIPTMDDYQKVTIQCTDVAGNVTNLAFNNLLVSVKAEELLLEDNLTPTAKLDAGIPAVAAALRSSKTLVTGIILILAAAALVGASVYRKKKHN